MTILSKKDKKIARAAIEKGVLAEYKIALEAAETILKDWRNGLSDNEEAYHKLYKSVMKQDKQIGERYNGMTGSSYVLIVAAILSDGYITEEDIKELSEETKQKIKLWIHMWNDDE